MKQAMLLAIVLVGYSVSELHAGQRTGLWRWLGMGFGDGIHASTSCYTFEQPAPEQGLPAPPSEDARTIIPGSRPGSPADVSTGPGLRAAKKPAVWQWWHHHRFQPVISPR